MSRCSICAHSSGHLFVVVNLRSLQKPCEPCVCLSVWIPGVHRWMCWRSCASETELYKGAAPFSTASFFGSSSQTCPNVQVIYHLLPRTSEQQRSFYLDLGKGWNHFNVNTYVAFCVANLKSEVWYCFPALVNDTFILTFKYFFVVVVYRRWKLYKCNYLLQIFYRKSNSLHKEEQFLYFLSFPYGLFHITYSK